MKIVRPDLPVILCTGHDDRVSESLEKELGLSRFFLKPIDRKELALAINEILAIRKR